VKNKLVFSFVKPGVFAAIYRSKTGLYHLMAVYLDFSLNLPGFFVSEYYVQPNIVKVKIIKY